MNNLTLFLKKNVLYVAYTAIFVILLIAVFHHSGTRFFPLLGLFFASLTLGYFLFLNAFNRVSFFDRKKEFSSSLASFNPRIFLSFLLFFILYHYYILGEIPIISAMLSDDKITIALIRQSRLENTPTWMNYLSGFILKGFLPFFIFYTYLKKQKFNFFAFVIIGSFYAFSLIQKSLIITIFIPLFLSLILYRKYLRSAILGLFLVGCLFALVKISAVPSKVTAVGTIESNTKIVSDAQRTPIEQVTKIAIDITKRIFITPGKVVSIWFTKIPDEHPYLHGCGYAFLAPALDCEYQNYISTFYNEEFPEYHAKKLNGTLVTASFMHEFANFGWKGLIGSGLLLGLLFAFLQKLFNDEWKLLLIFNFYPILVLSSSAISTLMLSHAWGITILLFLFYRKQLTNNNTSYNTSLPNE